MWWMLPTHILSHIDNSCGQSAWKKAWLQCSAWTLRSDNGDVKYHSVIISNLLWRNMCNLNWIQYSSSCCGFIEASSSLTSNNKLVSCQGSLNYLRCQNNSVSFSELLSVVAPCCIMSGKKNHRGVLLMNAALLSSSYTGFNDPKEKGRYLHRAVPDHHGSHIKI